MKLFWSLIGFTSAYLFYFGIKANAHPVDMHLPTSYDYMHEREYETKRSNEKAEETLSNPEASDFDIDKALEQLYGPNGNRI